MQAEREGTLLMAHLFLLIINLSISPSKIKVLLELVKKCPKLYNIMPDHDDRVNFFEATQNELKRTQGIIL